MGSTRIRAMVPADLRHVTLDAALPFATQVLTDPSAAWARAAQDQWGLCGVMLVEDEALRSAVLVCPGLHLPTGHPIEWWARVPGAANLVALSVADPADGERTTRLLSQGLARRLHGQVCSVEAVGSPAGGTVAPAIEWLVAAGFTPAGDPPLDGCERFGLDLGNTLRWRDDLNRAWDLLAGLVARPARQGAPGGAARSDRCRRAA